ncbi:hypothetical protein TNCV_2762131 [Trichonephila clavipes]|nr:hypothetical protein TNCV_2762131 [Trichonephila clavipes]
MQADLRPLAGRSINGESLLLKPWRCRVWSYYVRKIPFLESGILMVFGGPFFSLNTFPVARKAPIHIKTHFTKGSLHSKHRPTIRKMRFHGKKRAAASITTFLRLRRAETQIPYSSAS